MATTPPGAPQPKPKTYNLRDIGRIDFTLDRAAGQKWTFDEINLANITRIADALEKQNDLQLRQCQAMEAVADAIYRIEVKHDKTIVNLQRNLDHYREKLKAAGIPLTGGRRKAKK